MSAAGGVSRDHFLYGKGPSRPRHFGQLPLDPARGTYKRDLHPVMVTSRVAVAAVLAYFSGWVGAYRY